MFNIQFITIYYHDYNYYKGKLGLCYLQFGRSSETRLLSRKSLAKFSIANLCWSCLSIAAGSNG